MYFKIVIFLILTIFVWGVALPYLVSQPHTELVTTGIIIGVAYFPIAWAMVNKIGKDKRIKKLLRGVIS